MAGLILISEVGYADITVRKLAEKANTNSALVFYHFGSVDEVLLAGLKQASDRRLTRYKNAFAKADSPLKAISTLKKLWRQDNSVAEVDSIRELVANHAFIKQHRDEVNRELVPWFEFVEAEVERWARGNPLLTLIKSKDIAFGLIALVMGIETLQRLMPSKQSVNALMGSAEMIVQMFTSVSADDEGVE